MNNKIMITTVFMTIMLMLSATGCAKSEPLQIPELPEEISNVSLPEISNSEYFTEYDAENADNGSTKYEPTTSRVPILPKDERPIVIAVKPSFDLKDALKPQVQETIGSAPTNDGTGNTTSSSSASNPSVTYTKNNDTSENIDSAKISETNILISNKQINGDLVIDAAIGQKGSIVLENVKIKGKLIVQGGGIYDGILLSNCEIPTIEIENKTGSVRVATANKTTVKNTIVTTDAILMERSIQNGYTGFENIEVKGSTSDTNKRIVLSFTDAEIGTLTLNGYTNLSNVNSKISSIVNNNYLGYSSSNSSSNSNSNSSSSSSNNQPAPYNLFLTKDGTRLMLNFDTRDSSSATYEVLVQGPGTSDTIDGSGKSIDISTVIKKYPYIAEYAVSVRVKGSTYTSSPVRIKTGYRDLDSKVDYSIPGKVGFTWTAAKDYISEVKVTLIFGGKETAATATGSDGKIFVDIPQTSLVPGTSGSLEGKSFKVKAEIKGKDSGDVKTIDVVREYWVN